LNVVEHTHANTGTVSRYNHTWPLKTVSSHLTRYVM